MKNSRSQANYKPHHFFQPILPTSYQQLSIPMSFMDNLKEENVDRGEAILKSSSHHVGRSWRVKVVDGRHFEQGWKEFAEDHNLHVGDLCVFKHEGGLVFNVTVFDSTTCEKEYCHQVPLSDNNLTHEVSSRATPVLVKEAEQFHCFTAILQQHTFKKFLLYIPIKFARTNGLFGKIRTVTLQNDMGKCWDMKLRFEENSDQQKVIIGCGWKNFLEDNSLKVGDVCTFRLLPGKNVVMEVSISRS